MRRLFLVSLLVSVLILSSDLPAPGCGDKLLVLGRSVSFGALTGLRPANILAYLHAGTQGSTVLSDPQLQSVLKKAGHQLRLVENPDELNIALHSGKYDLVLADLADATAMESTLKLNPGSPVVVPVLSDPTKAEITTAERHYQCVLKSERKSSNYLFAIDKALEVKLKRGRGKFGGVH